MKLDQGDWSRQSWYESFCEFIQLLWRPQAAELLPQSSASAASGFENIIPLVYEDAELNIIIDNENETETGPLPDASLADLYHQDNSNPENSMPHDTVDVQSQYSTQEQTDQNQRFDEDSTEIPIRSGGYESDEDSSEFIEEWDDTGFSVHDAENFGQNTGQNSEVLRDSVIEIQASQHTTLHPRLEALLKQQDEYKLSLLEIQKKLGDHHPDTLQVMENLAHIHHQLGELRLARALQVVVLEKRTISLGDDDPVTLHIMGALGDTYHSLGQFNKAEELKMSVLEKRTQVLSIDHPDTLLAMSSLASTYQETWQMRRAEPLLTVALDKQLKILADNNPDTFRTMSTLALTYGQLGKSKNAEELYIEVLGKQCALLGEHHPDALWTMGHLASQCHALRQVNRAQKLYIEVLEKNRRALGEAHPDTLWTMAGLASTYHDLGELRKADWFNLSVLEKQKKLGSPKIENQFKHAEKLFVAVLERQREILGDSHRRTRWTIRNLALTYESLGKLQEMEALEALLRQSV
ncbi:hypothetical protein B0H14DRAFT_2543796 [Mycena olivaceomarginata]|nr:hypothetical protein B0H14DRAFT_2543796 [Mycena olivaceomarginata]